VLRSHVVHQRSLRLRRRGQPVLRLGGLLQPLVQQHHGQLQLTPAYTPTTLHPSPSEHTAMTDALHPDASAALITWFDSDTLDAPIDPSTARRWFTVDPIFDGELRARFGPAIEAAARGHLAAWEESPRGALALLLLLDQFTRNVYRESPQAFVADPVAQGVADRAVARGFDQAVPFSARAFFYLPFEHAEDLALQDRALALFQALAAKALPEESREAEVLCTYAEKHRAVIARFGRFPHRNKVLGRESTAEEVAFLAEGRGF
jgi:uncharacterized protein (DUF924 family)